MSLSVILHSVAHFTASLMLVYGVMLLMRSRGILSTKVLAVTMLIRGGLSWIMILGEYGAVNLSYNILQPGMIVSGAFMATTFFFYPWTAVYPERFTLRYIVLLLLPLLATIGAFAGIKASGMQIRDIHDFGDILLYIGEPNVWLRVLISALAYILPCWGIALCLRAQSTNQQANTLRIYGYGMVVMNVVYAIILFVSSRIGPILQLAWVNVFFTLIVYRLVSNRYVRTSMPHGDKVSQPDSNAAVNPRPVPAKPENNTLPLFDRLEEVMVEKKPYLNSEITLPELATLMGTNRTTLSNSIRKAGYKSFQEYMNRYRMAEFKRKAAENNGASLEELALQVGFGSKRTLFRCFQEYEGITPRLAGTDRV